MSKTIYKIYVDEQFRMSIHADEVVKQSPTWDGKVPMPNEIITFNDKEMRVKEAKHHFPDSEKDDYYIDLYLKEI